MTVDDIIAAVASLLAESDLDGHVAFLEIRKGLHVTPEYTVIPSKWLQNVALECQEDTGSRSRVDRAE